MSLNPANDRRPVEHQPSGTGCLSRIESTRQLSVEICCPHLDTYRQVVAALDAAQASHGAFFRVRQCSITDASHDTIVSAGNSFAEMNGGVDGIINSHLSAFTLHSRVQDIVKAAISREWGGELPVGASIVVDVRHPVHRRLVYAPTMRVACELEAGSLNPYLAFRGACITAARHGIRSLSTPLFCTGAGGVPVPVAVAQMLAAYTSVTGAGEDQTAWQWPELHARHRELLKAGSGTLN